MPRNTAKLTWEIAEKIRAEYEHGATLRQLGAKYGVAMSSIHKIVHHETYVEKPIVVDPVEFGKRLKDARAAKGLTMAEVSRRAAVNESYYRLWLEPGRCIANNEIAAKLIELLEIPPDV